MPKLLLINRYYAPDHSATAQLLTDVAEHLASHGQSVTVITSRLRYDDPKASLPGREIIHGVAVVRVWTTRFGRAGLWGRALDYASFYLSAFLTLLAETRRSDTIMAKTDPPLISVPAAVVARLKGARLVNWCQDLFPETAAALGLRWAGGRLGQLLQKLRNWSLRGAECNVVLCDEMLSYLNSEGLPKQSLRVIHNWPAQSIAPLPRVRQSNEPFTIVYSGNLGRAHSVASIIDLIKRTRHLPLHWLFIGGGAGRERLRQVAATEGAFGNVTFAPYAPFKALSQSLANADLHLVSLDPACESLIMPSKLYGIMAAGRPTVFLGNPEGAVAQILRTHAAGMTLDGARPETYLPALEALVKNPDRLAAMGRNARRAFERHYSAEHSLKAWFDVLIGAPAPSDLAIRPERTAT